MPVQVVDIDSRVVICRMRAPPNIGTFATFLVDITGYQLTDAASILCIADPVRCRLLDPLQSHSSMSSSFTAGSLRSALRPSQRRRNRRYLLPALMRMNGAAGRLFDLG